MIKKLDHYDLTTSDVQKAIDFYSVLGFKPIKNGNNYVLVGPNFLIKLHSSSTIAIPLPKNVQKGCIDICFEANENLDLIIKYLNNHGIPLVMGPVERVGFNGPMTSIYIYDPDGNLIELSNYGAIY